MPTVMAACGGVTTTLCGLLAVALVLGSVMGQDDEDLPNMLVPPPSPGNGDAPPPPPSPGNGDVPSAPSNWFWDVPPSWDGTPPVSTVPSYQNGHPAPVDYKKSNRIFICDSDNGGTLRHAMPGRVSRCTLPNVVQLLRDVVCLEFDPQGAEVTWVIHVGTLASPAVTGVTFYFHGKRDRDFCIVSDADLHINAHFIGNYNPANERTFTWIQAIGVSFGDHRLYLGARKAVVWDDEEDHIQITFDGEPINIDPTSKARWVSKVQTGLSVERTNTVNSVVVNLAGVFKITASAVPITDEDSKIHNYGRTTKDSLAHLDLRFKFHSLTDSVDGVLGQTYRPNYVNKMNVTVKMPIMGGTPKYISSGLFSTDCPISNFHRSNGVNHVHALAE